MCATVPPQSVIEHAHTMAVAGADLVLGHHPHVLQGIERFGKCLIVYSLGNFVFDTRRSRYRETALFRCTLKSVEVHNFEFVPLKINQNFQPAFATKSQATSILQKIKQRTCAITDPQLVSLRDDVRVAQIERKVKRWHFFSPVLYLAASLGRMGPRVAYQKLRRRIPVLPRWL